MKFVIAPDSFKGTLSQVEVANVMKNAILKKWPTAEIMMKPMADGGEGTLEALLAASEKSERLTINVTGPLGKRLTTNIGIINNDTVIIEVAVIAGLPLVPKTSRHPYYTTTYGVGEAIIFALNNGYKKFIVGLGGSATNDGGLGMLQALGATMQTKNNKRANIFGKDLFKITNINLSTIDSRIWDCEIVVASDVDHPLTGENGATYIFGPQKGLTNEELKITDQAMLTYATLVEQSAKLTKSYINDPGAGSAGGLGFAFLVLNGKIVSGAEIVGETIALESCISEANFVFTGEGKSDMQTLYGKAPGYVAKLANKYEVPSLLISGSVSEVDLLTKQFTKIYSLVDEHVTLQRALTESKTVLLNKLEYVLIDLEKSITDN
ncbi:MAG TPA: glycerate kinase [Bacillota bacterium]|nr:glycerate kinase [Bacillota bacterium]